MSITSLVFFFWIIAGTTAPIAYEPYSEMGLQPPTHCEAFVIGPQGDILCTEAAVYPEDLTGGSICGDGLLAGIIGVNYDSQESGECHPKHCRIAGIAACLAATAIAACGWWLCGTIRVFDRRGVGSDA
mgnify:CR=1 FL=1